MFGLQQSFQFRPGNSSSWRYACKSISAEVPANGAESIGYEETKNERRRWKQFYRFTRFKSKGPLPQIHIHIQSKRQGNWSLKFQDNVGRKHSQFLANVKREAI